MNDTEERKNFHLQPGRLVIKCCKAFNLNSTNTDIKYVNLCFKFTLCKAGESQVAYSKPLPDPYNDLDLQDIIVNFDIIDPVDFKLKSHFSVKVELLHENKLVHDILGEATVSIASLFPISSNSTMFTDRFSFSSVDDLVSNNSVELEFSYVPVHEGILTLFLNSDVLSSLALSMQDVTFQIKMEKVSKEVQARDVHSPSGTQIHFELTRLNWFQSVTINIQHRRKLIAWSTLTPADYTNNDSEYNTSLQFYTPKSLSLQSDSQVPLGISPLKIRFLQSGIMYVQEINTSSLRVIGNTGITTLQIVFTCEGMASTLRTEVNVPNHPISSFDNRFSMNLVDHDELHLECFLLDALGNRIRRLGSGKLSLFPVYTRGSYKSSVPIEHHKDEGVIEDIGSIFLSVEFHGNGQKFPKLHPMKSVITTCFDQAVTDNRLVSDFNDNALSDKGCEIFTDEDIKSTFDLCDLDRNGYIGTTELRHVLICMGEIVSEEEIDTMIHMLDKNGDGQVDFHQFSKMAKSTNFEIDSSNQSDFESQKCNNSVETDFHQQKLQALSDFVTKFNLNKDRLDDLCELLYQKRNSVYLEAGALEMDQYSRSCAIWSIDFSTLRRLLHLDDISDLRNVFEILKSDDSMKQEIDARDFILGMMSFIPSYSVYERTKIMFDLYDERRTGYIQANDVVSMLAACHLKPRDAVIRKSETVLKVADSRESGQLTHQDLLNAATKFPNLLFFKLPKS